jgi:hypothetical protein
MDDDAYLVDTGLIFSFFLFFFFDLVFLYDIHIALGLAFLFSFLFEYSSRVGTDGEGIICIYWGENG